jgi:hypothetical protein
VNHGLASRSKRARGCGESRAFATSHSEEIACTLNTHSCMLGVVSMHASYFWKLTA